MRSFPFVVARAAKCGWTSWPTAALDGPFLPSSSWFYFDDILREKQLRYVPNTCHSLAKSNARESMAVFCDAVLPDRPRPRYPWTFAQDGRIELRSGTPPAEVRLWRAINAHARDFRLSSRVPGGIHVIFHRGHLPFPDKFTTGVRVVRERLPHPAHMPKSRERR
jgi:PhoPQ-activated pathogenicity-related protein